MKGCGRKAFEREWVERLGPMEAFTKDNFCKIKNMAKVLKHIVTAHLTKAHGKRAISLDSVIAPLGPVLYLVAHGLET